MLEHHSSDDIVLVAAGLMKVVATPDAADQLRRLYGEERAVRALALRARGRVVVLPDTVRAAPAAAPRRQLDVLV